MAASETPPAGTVPRWVAILAAIAGIVLIGALAAYGLQTSERLATERSTLAARDADLVSAQAVLTTAEGDLASATSTHQARSAEQATAKETVAGQTACIRAQQADLIALREIAGRVIENFNKTAEGSDFSKAATARFNALQKAGTAYYDSALARSRGQTSTANATYATARSQEAKAADQKVIQQRILADVDATAKRIEADLTAFEAQLTKTATTCGLGT